VSSECHFHVYGNAGGNIRAEKRPIRPVSMIKDLPVINKENIPFPFTPKGSIQNTEDIQEVTGEKNQRNHIFGKINTLKFRQV
jgi:hypothetical protein